MFAFFCTGLSALTLEVAWTRTLCMFLGSSVYGFALILMSFLIGLALGSWFFARAYAERPVTLGLFGGVACGIGITCLVLSALFPYLPYAFLGLYVGFTFMPLWVLYTLQFAICLSVTLVPTCMMGMTFPIVAKICADRSGKLGDAVGKSYAANTAGAIVGSGLSGLLFIPLLGLQGTVKTFSLVYVVVGAIAVSLGIAASARNRGTGWAAFWTGTVLLLSAAAFVFLPPWHKGALTSGIFRQSFGSTSGVGNIQRSEEDIIFYKEGTSCTVSVIQGTDADGDVWKSLAVNGKADASTLPADMITQQLTGHLPVLLQDTPSRCLLIGLGSGCSAAAICSHDDVREVEVAELEHQVVEGAKYLSEINRGVLEEGAEPKLKIRVMDGRTTLLGSEGVYDIVISEPSNPWISGVSNLFTTEHYEACRKALRPTGTFCQWAQGYDLNRETLHMMFATLQKVFPRATVWQTTNYDYLFIARMDGKPVDYQRLVDKFRTNAQLKKDLTPYRHASPGGILACYVMGPEKLAEIAQGGMVNHDDLPLLEFWAPKGLYDHDPQGIFKWVRGYASQDLPTMSGFDATQVDWAQLRVDMGNALFNKEIYGEARENALRALDANPDFSPAYVLLGEAEWKLDRPIRALRALEQARDLNPFDLNAHLLLAQLHIETGLPQQALAEAEAARTVQPGNAEALRLINRANAKLAELGQRAGVLDRPDASAVE
jgi:spermidine synthase